MGNLGTPARSWRAVKGEGWKEGQARRWRGEQRAETLGFFVYFSKTFYFVLLLPSSAEDAEDKSVNSMWFPLFRAAIEIVISYNEKKRRGRSNLPGLWANREEMPSELGLKGCLTIRDSNRQKDPEVCTCTLYCPSGPRQHHICQFLPKWERLP